MASQQAAQIEQMKSQSELQKLEAEYAMKEQFAQAEHQREMEILKMEGVIKTGHIQEANDDSDLVRVKKGVPEGESE